MSSRVYVGNPFPLGATWDGSGVNFAVYAENATGVDICLFESVADDSESVRIKMQERSGHIWHACD